MVRKSIELMKPDGGGMMTIGGALQEARDRLQAREGWRLDAEVLLCHVLGCRRIDLVTRSEEELDGEPSMRFAAALARRAAHEPVAYITGEREFYGRPFLVGPGVLIPRPETEALVDAVLSWAAGRAEGLRVLDIGTGSGAIALTLALEMPTADIWASDCSPNALDWAKRNACGLLAETFSSAHKIDSEGQTFFPRTGRSAQVHLVSGSCYAGIEGRFDVLVSNPPYLTDEEVREAMPDVREWEPELALVARDGGLAVYRAIIKELPHRLTPGGLAAFEISDTVAGGVQDEARRAGFVCEMEDDLAGHKRVAVLRTPLE